MLPGSSFPGKILKFYSIQNKYYSPRVHSLRLNLIAENKYIASIEYIIYLKLSCKQCDLIEKNKYNIRGNIELYIKYMKIKRNIFTGFRIAEGDWFFF